MLKIENLQVHYGGIQALRGISLEVPDGRIVTLIGANGAGKSTTLRTITGLVKASGGSVQWDGQELLSKSIDKIISTGIAMSPEGRRVFPDMTVLENLKIGAYLRRDKAEIEKDIQWVYSLFPRLEERSWQLAGTLSGGEQQMLAVGRALMSRPKLMMLDEPSLGLAPLVVQDIFSIIREINRQGVTVLLVEQNANMALKIADLAYVLETGTITMSGTGAKLSGAGTPVAGKTGTVNMTGGGNRDIWMACYNSEISCAFWMGFDEPDQKHKLQGWVSGGDNTAAMARNYFKAL